MRDIWQQKIISVQYQVVCIAWEVRVCAVNDPWINILHEI